jgi:predicted RNA-binding protein with PIN domain
MPARIVIDGYNLIRQSPFFGPMEKLDMEEARKNLIEFLWEYKKLKACRITVVFDAGGVEYILPRVEKIKGIEVIFSRHGEKADDVIKRLSSKEKEAIIVVTSDREIAKFSERNGSAVISSRDFEERLNMALYHEMKGIIENDEGDNQYMRISTRKKGPSMRLPKAKRRAKMKLSTL